MNKRAALSRPHFAGPRAFTLVELTLVFAITAALGAILFPVFAQARNKARQVQCGYGLYQLGVALQLYGRDHDGRFPPRHHALEPLAGRYLPALPRCPEDALAEQLAGTTYPGYQYRGGLMQEERADIPLVADWAFHHSDGAYVLFLSGSVKWIARSNWVPVAPGPRPLPAGMRAPAAPVPMRFLPAARPAAKRKGSGP